MKFLHRLHSFLTHQERLDAELNWIKKVWYIILVGITSRYVLCNFSELVSFTFFEDFDGKNLIFLLWLVLLLIPLFDNFEGFGLRFGKQERRVSRASQEIADEVLSNSANSADNVESLRDKLKDISKEFEQ